jgi:hypothetical protein
MGTMRGNQENKCISKSVSLGGLISLAPSFSWVFNGLKDFNRFSGFRFGTNR